MATVSSTDKSFVWEIPRFQILNGNWSSPLMAVGQKNISKWILLQDPNAEQFQLRFNIKNIVAQTIPIHLELSLSILDKLMTKMGSKTKIINLDFEGKEIPFCCFDLRNCESLKVIFVLCEFKNFDTHPGKEQLLNLVCPCINDYQLLKTNEKPFANFLNDQVFSDVQLVVQGKKYPAHKLILVANSPVFYKMFSHQMKETISKEVEIKEISTEIFEALLEYMYTRKVSGLEYLVKRLLIAANRYEIEELKLICEHELVRKLNFETVIEFIIFANIHEAAYLKKHCFSFFVKNFNRCTALDDFMDLGNTHPSILVDLCREIAVNCKVEFRDRN